MKKAVVECVLMALALTVLAGPLGAKASASPIECASFLSDNSQELREIKTWQFGPHIRMTAPTQPNNTLAIRILKFKLAANLTLQEVKAKLGDLNKADRYLDRGVPVTEAMTILEASLGSTLESTLWDLKLIRRWRFLPHRPQSQLYRPTLEAAAEILKLSRKADLDLAAIKIELDKLNRERPFREALDILSDSLN